jgi:hypothetical protein
MSHISTRASGTWLDWWGSISLDSQGAPHFGAAEVLSGAGNVTLPAPIDELPMLVGEGAVIPLGNTWVLDIRSRRTRTYEIEAWLGFLGSGTFRACNVRALGALTRPRWTYDSQTGVLDVQARGRRVRLVTRSC